MQRGRIPHGPGACRFERQALEKRVGTEGEKRQGQMEVNEEPAREDLRQKRRAWTLAHKLICLARIVSREEGAHLLEVTTQ